MNRARVLFLTGLLVLATAVAMSAEDAPQRWNELKGSEAAPYSQLFAAEYERLRVSKQICDAFGFERTDDDKSDFPVSLQGPKFYEQEKSGRVIGVLGIGISNTFQVEFENKRTRKCSFVNGWTGKSFETFGECFKFNQDLWMRATNEGEASSTQQSSENCPRNIAASKTGPKHNDRMPRRLKLRVTDQPTFSSCLFGRAETSGKPN